jgi:hypothetical protein
MKLTISLIETRGRKAPLVCLNTENPEALSLLNVRFGLVRPHPGVMRDSASGFFVALSDKRDYVSRMVKGKSFCRSTAVAGLACLFFASPAFGRAEKRLKTIKNRCILKCKLSHFLGDQF